MHPLFNLANLQSLPSDIREHAEAFLEDRSNDFSPVVDYMSSNKSKDALLPLLCVFSQILNPNTIPTIENQPTKIAHSWLLLSAICSSPLIAWASEEGAGDDVFRHFWPWFSFLEKRSAAGDLVRHSLCPPLNESLVTLLNELSLDTKPIAFIFSAPGCLASLIRAWKTIPQMPRRSRRAGTRLLVRVLCSPRCMTEPAMPLLIDGAGGSACDLAAFLISFLNYALLRLEKEDLSLSPLSTRGKFATNLIRAPFSFLYSSDAVFCHPTEQPSTHTALGTALLEPQSGFVSIIARALRKLSTWVHCPDNSTLLTVHPILNALEIVLYIAPGHLRLPEVIANGVLQSVIRIASHHLMLVTPLFQLILPAGLVRLQTLAALKPILGELVELAATDAFRRSKIFKDWAMFLPLANNRLRILEQYLAGGFKPWKMCDNTKCSQIAYVESFQMCSGCRMMHYCSPECQKVDWKSGGHKKGCMAMRLLQIRETQNDLTPEDRDFIRVLMDVDLRADRHQLFGDELHVVTSLGHEPLTIFNYGQPARAPVDGRSLMVVVISAEPSTEERSDEALLSGRKRMFVRAFGSGQAGETIWEEVLRRAKTSGGKIMLDVVLYAAGAEEHALLIPRRVQVPRMPELWQMREYLVQLNRSGLRLPPGMAPIELGPTISVQVPQESDLEFH